MAIDTEILGSGTQRELRKILPDVPLSGSRNITEAELNGRFKLVQVPFWAQPNLADDRLLAAIGAAREWADSPI
jgi:hypothetical protein